MIVVLIAWFGAMMAAATAQGAKLSQFTSLVTNPVAPRGGVLMLPLVSEEGVSVRLRDLVLRDSNGNPLQITPIWVQWQPQPGYDSWATDPRQLHVSAVRDGEAASEYRRLFILARLPVNGSGELRLGQQRLTPLWRDVPQNDSGERGGQLTLIDSPARPDAFSPFEYWRWLLLADELGADPPTLQPYGELGSLIAEHFADMWRIGLNRLNQHDPDLEGRLRSLLTHTCMDRQQVFAVWPIDGASINQLLSVMLDPQRAAASMVNEVAAWIEAEQVPFFWIETTSSTFIELAVVNPADYPQVAQFTWVDEGLRTGRSPIPIAAELSQGQLTRVRLDRPADAAGRVGRSLRMQVGAWSDEIVLGPGALVVRPPGLTLPPAQPALTLAQARQGSSGAVPTDQSTFLQVRRLTGRWELFIECLRQEFPEVPDRDHARFQADRASLGRYRGCEGVIISIGSGVLERPPVILFVPENGWHDVVQGDNDGTLRVHRQSYSDRWYARIVLPNDWIDAMIEGDVTSIGVIRTLQGQEAVQATPFALPPWRMRPGTIAVDLMQWHDLPGTAGGR